MLSIKTLKRIEKIGAIFHEVRPYLSGKTLDFGCGDGIFTNCLNDISPFSDIVGYDHCERVVKNALLRKVNGNMTFSSSREILIPEKYDSVVSTFVSHENDSDIFLDMYDVLKKDGSLCVLDYNLKGVGREEFSRIFASDIEVAEIESMGFNEAWRIHTAKGLDECVMDAERVGFETISSQVLGDNYFLWVGKK
jgi:2-polyprenyl-3-methyl-5-hydroxy-6-metoxy-1,4-benzoquinol methylase